MNGEVVNGRYTPYSRQANQVEQRPVIEVSGVKEGLTVGPDEVLVIVCHDTQRWELEAVRNRMRDTGLRPDQILLFGGNVTIGKAAKDNIRILMEGTDDG